MTPIVPDTDILPLLDPHVVVVVDDDPEALSAVRRALRAEPCVLLTTEHPGQALEWVGRREVSLLLCDYRMPEMSGAETLVEARRRSPETTRVFLTAYPEQVPLPDEVVRCVIHKPWDVPTLRKVVRQLLRERELVRRRREAPPPIGDWDLDGGDRWTE